MAKITNRAIETAVFDVCDTLYYSNTTHDFVAFVFQNERSSSRKLLYRILNSRWLPFRYFLIFVSVKTGKDLLKKFNVGCLKGRSRDDLERLSLSFVMNFLTNKKIEYMHNVMQSHKESGHRIVLCSSSIEPVVGAVAKELRIHDYVSTSLSYDGDVFTGAIANEISRNKVDALRECDLLGRLEFAASDNTTDIELLSLAKDAIVVIHAQKKEKFWNKYDFKVLNLST